VAKDIAASDIRCSRTGVDESAAIDGHATALGWRLGILRTEAGSGWRAVIEPLYVHTGGVKSLSDIHDEVAGAMSQLRGSTPDAVSLETAYGTISSAFTSAIGRALPSRDTSLRATQTSSQTIRELLQRAAEMFERGDQQSADELRAAADALAGSSGADATCLGPVGGAGPDMACPPVNQAAQVGQAGQAGQVGQVAQVSQVGQQIAQIAQGVAQAAMGLAQGFSQLPQQIMQGAQAKESHSEGPNAHDVDHHEEEDCDERRRDDESHQRPHAPATHTEGAKPGAHASGGIAPTPAAEPPQPAQTRPQ
jgi:hypothetical protein